MPTDDRYTEETIEMLAIKLSKMSADTASLVHGYRDPYSAEEIWAKQSDVLRNGYREDAREALTALADAGLLLIDDEAHYQYGRRIGNGMIVPAAHGETHVRLTGEWTEIAEGDDD